MGELRLNFNKHGSDYTFNQKGVDMRIGLDIASITTNKLCDRIVLISGDSDMIPAMKKARKEGITVYLNVMNDFRPCRLELAEHSDIILHHKYILPKKKPKKPTSQ